MSSHKVLSVENAARTITSKDEAVFLKIDIIVGSPFSSITPFLLKRKSKSLTFNDDHI